MRLRSEPGLSLVEATIILAVLSVLTAVIAPSIMNYVQDAQNTTAQGDVQAIGSGITQMLKDTGSRCLRTSGTTDCTIANRVDLLISGGGSDPMGVAATAANVTLPDSESATTATVNWLGSGAVPAQQDLIDDQLIENDNPTPYSVASQTAGGGPRMKLGWRGAYLNGPIMADPWGIKYQVNSIFLAVATDAFDTAGSPDQLQEGLREAGWNRDVLVLSSGSNRVVETPFGGSASGGVSAVGDDVIYVIRGGTR
jgi:type II secretory pathway pseudopilin PulG